MAGRQSAVHDPGVASADPLVAPRRLALVTVLLAGFAAFGPLSMDLYSRGGRGGAVAALLATTLLARGDLTARGLDRADEVRAQPIEE